MFLNSETIQGKKTSIHDCAGNVIPGVVTFDTETFEAEMVIFLVQEAGAQFRPMLRVLTKDGRQEPLIAKVKIPGAYAIVDGQKI